MQDGSLGSPLKNLERISEELRSERSKASLAMQEKARLRIEVENLKQLLEKQAEHVRELNFAISKSESETNFAKQDIAKLELKLQNETKLLSDTHKEIENLKIEISANSISHDAIAKELIECNQKLSMSQSKIDLSESLSRAKESAHSDLQSELFQLRKKFSETERHCDHYKLLYDEVSRSNDDYKLKLAQSDLSKEQHAQLQISYTEIKRDYESSLAFSNDLSKKNMILQQQNDEMKRSALVSQTESNELKATADKLRRDIAVMEASRDEVIKHLQAEKETAEAAQSKAAIALRGKTFLEQQLRDLELSQHESLRRAAKLENDLTTTNDKLRQLENEIVEHRQRSAKVSSLEAQAREHQSMEVEIEALKSHLADVKRQLVKRDVDEEASAMAPKAIFERESQSRQVYETIIGELRNEIDKLQARNGELQSSLEQYLSLTSKCQQLQMEVDMYREAAKQASLETHNVSLSASEAMERSSRVSHDKSTLVRELQRLESDAHLHKSDLNRLSIELENERSRRKDVYAEKLSSDRKLAEASAAKVRLEAVIDDEKQKRVFDSLEIDRQKKTIVDLNTYVSDLTGRIQDLESMLHDKDSKYSSCSTDLQILRQSEEVLHSKLKMAQHSIISLQKEKETVESKVQYLRASSESVSNQIRIFVAENEELRNEKESFKRKLAQVENGRQEDSLRTIKSDLENTVNEFNKFELDRSQKDGQIGVLSADFRREKERNSFLKAQLSTAEEKIGALSKEIAVYRSIDVYKPTKFASTEAKNDHPQHYVSMYSMIAPNEDSIIMNQLRSSLNSRSGLNNRDLNDMGIYSRNSNDNNNNNSSNNTGSATIDQYSDRKGNKMGVDELGQVGASYLANKNKKNSSEHHNSSQLNVKFAGGLESELDASRAQDSSDVEIGDGNDDSSVNTLSSDVSDKFNSSKANSASNAAAANTASQPNNYNNNNNNNNNNDNINHLNSRTNSSSGEAKSSREQELEAVRLRKLERGAKRAEMIRIQMTSGGNGGIITPKKNSSSDNLGDRSNSLTKSDLNRNNKPEKSPISTPNNSSITIEIADIRTPPANGNNQNSNSKSGSFAKFDFERAKRILNSGTK